MVKLQLAVGALIAGSMSFGGALAQAPPPATPAAAPPSDGITMDMMPITQEQIAACRSQATQQLADEQKTLHGREHGQDNDKMKQGAVTGATGLATSAVSRGRGGWWGWGNNNGANTAAATGATQRTDRNSDNVASTTATSQTVGVDAYTQCVNGIKGPEYIHFRQTGQMTAYTPNGPQSAPAAVAAVTTQPVTPAPAAAAATKPSIQDEGDGKHVILTMPGDPDPKELTKVPGNDKAFMDSATGDKYIQMPDGSVTRIKHVTRKAAQ